MPLKPRIYHFLNKNILLNLKQFGLRLGMSTEATITKQVASIEQGFEEGKSNGITMCDLRKSIECVSHLGL